MNYLALVEMGIDYIEAHLEEDLDTAAVAAAAGISHWHFQRIFKALTNETLKTYIRSRRFALCLDRLAHSRERILDIALGAGYESQESFTRAFKSAFQLTPADYRRRRKRPPFLRKVRFDRDYLQHIHAGLSSEPEIYQQPGLTLVGLKTRYFGVDSEKNNIADKLPALWDDFLGRMVEVENQLPDVGYGLIRQTPEMTDELEYYAVIGVSKIDRVPSGMVVFHLPESRYAKFTHHGHIGQLDKTINYIYSSWLLRSGMRHSYGCDLEIYGKGYLPDSDDSVVHYAIPVEIS